MAIDQKLNGVYDVTTFEWVSVRCVANIIASLTGAKVVLGDLRGSTPITPMRGKVTGWSSSVSLERGLELAVALFKQQDVPLAPTQENE